MSDFYLRRAGREQAGPFTEDELRSMAHSGLIPHDAEIRSALVQHWSPISSAPEIASLIDDFPGDTDDDDTPPDRAYAAYERSAPRTRPASQPGGHRFDPAAPRPWVRFWARAFDYQLFFTAIGIIFLPFALMSDEELDDGAEFIVFIIGTSIFRFIWVFIEAAFLTKYGATPGKMLLKTTVSTPQGERLSTSTANGRSFAVFAEGMAFGIPVLALITNLLGYASLISKDVAPWDHKHRTRVSHKRITEAGLVKFIAIFVAVLVVQAVTYLIGEG